MLCSCAHLHVLAHLEHVDEHAGHATVLLPLSLLLLLLLHICVSHLHVLAHLEHVDEHAGHTRGGRKHDAGGHQDVDLLRLDACYMTKNNTAERRT